MVLTWIFPYPFWSSSFGVNYHETSRKPVVSRIALLDSRYKRYQDACIGTVEATLSSGMAMVTLFPNFTMSLQDPNLMDALKVQIQIVNAEMIPKQELLKLLPEKWVTNYEQIHQHNQPIKSTKSQIITKADGTSEIRFDHSHLKQLPTPPVFTTQMMLQPVALEETVLGPEAELIQSFQADGRPLYYFKDPLGHCPWDINCSYQGCRDDVFEELDEDIRRTRKKKFGKKSTQSSFYERWMNGDPDIGPLGKDNGKFVYLVDCSSKRPQSPKVQNLSQTSPPSPPKVDPDQKWLAKPLKQPCYKQINKWVQKNSQFMTCSQEQEIKVPVPVQASSEVHMYTATSSYDQEFHPLKEFTKNEYLHVPKTSSKLQTDAEGKQIKIAAAEATLNWQSENAVAQNAAIKKIDHKIYQIDNKVSKIEKTTDENSEMIKNLIKIFQKRLKEVAHEPAAPGQDLFSHLAQREKEIHNLKEQIKYLKENGKLPPRQPAKNRIELFPSIRQTDSPRQGGTQPIIFPPPEPKKKPTVYELWFLKDYSQKILPKISVAERHESETTPATEEDDLVSSSGESERSANPYDSESIGETNNSSEEGIEDLPEVMATPGVKVEEPSDEEMTEAGEPSNARSAPHVSTTKTVFTLDDIPINKGPERLQEFYAWLDTRRLTEESQYNILSEFVSRFTGMLKDWWNSVTQADQLQFLVLTDFSQAIRIIHSYFIGNPDDLLTLKRREFFKRKCCSYQKKDLSKHFYAMIKLHYALGSEPSLKQAVVASLPDPIQQETFIALEDICNRRKVFKDYLHGDRRIDKACTDSHLKIKCGKEDKSCYCPTKKKKHFRREKGARKLKSQKKFRWRYLKKKKKFSKKAKSTRCYICNKKGHFAKDCPKKKKGAKMIRQIQQRSGIKITDEDDIESLFSIDDKPNDQSICAIQSRRKVFKDYLHGDRRIDKACTDSHLKIKCGKEYKSCYCPTKKKKHFRREKGARKLKSQKKFRWRYLKKKKKFSKKAKSTRCYICNKKGHFAKDCPKNKKGAKMIRQIQQRSGIKITDEDDIESLFSIDDEPNDQSICAIQSFASSDSEDSEFSSSDSSLMIQPSRSCYTLSDIPQDIASTEIIAPHIPVSIYMSKYSKPITVIAFIGIRACNSRFSIITTCLVHRITQSITPRLRAYYITPLIPKFPCFTIHSQIVVLAITHGLPPHLSVLPSLPTRPSPLPS
ncbi:hypothetical protein V6Z12_D08G115900 [Gossypium hirsutum]